MYQIELFGCTSAGKTTLSRKIVQSCKEEGIDLILVDEYLLSRLHVAWIQRKIFRLLFIDSFCMTACLLTIQKNFKLYQFCFRQISKLQIPWITKLNLLRNILKGIGTYEIIKGDKRRNWVAVLIDGGTFQSIQPLFVHNNLPINQNAIQTYSQLVSLPDIAIFFDQSPSVLKERIKARGHKRISTSSDEMIEDFISKARISYQSLLQNIVNAGGLSNFNSQPTLYVSNNFSNPRDEISRTLEIIIEKLDDAQK